jgi:hypothetical protein
VAFRGLVCVCVCVTGIEGRGRRRKLLLEGRSACVIEEIAGGQKGLVAHRLCAFAPEKRMTSSFCLPLWWPLLIKNTRRISMNTLPL